jgi:hypothetical protein
MGGGEEVEPSPMGEFGWKTAFLKAREQHDSLKRRYHP